MTKLVFPSWVFYELKETSTFKTHLNYIKCLDKLFDNCELTINIMASGKLDPKKLIKFQKLAEITQRSIDNEVSYMIQEPEYSQVVAPWLPVKCYYRLYYLESIFLYLLNGNEAVFKQGGHSAVRSGLHDALKGISITFKNIDLDSVIPIIDAINYKGTSGANVRNDFHESDECIKSIRKKISQYKEHNFKDRKTAKNYWMTSKGRQERKEFLTKNLITIIDYFYWMRIKANYKDVDFLDFEIISTSETKEYASYYVSAADKYAHALNKAIELLKHERVMN